VLRGLWRLTWLEIKIFLREPLGLVSSVAVPVVVFVATSRLVGPTRARGVRGLPRAISDDLPILAAMLILTSAVLSLVAIMAIYREGGILKRLRATPLRPHTILAAHVLAKLAFTAVTAAALVIAGRRHAPLPADVPLLSFTLAVLFSTATTLSLGFLVASVVPTARFAQPFGALVLYPMLGLSGLFAPIEALTPPLQGVARILPLTAATSLLRGIWHGEGWTSHGSDVVALALTCVVCTMVSAKVFRWE
jgi:ABC-2 type transport system permease protein